MQLKIKLTAHSDHCSVAHAQCTASTSIERHGSKWRRLKKLKMAEINRDCPLPSSNIERLNTPDTLTEIEEDFSWLHIFKYARVLNLFVLLLSNLLLPLPSRRDHRHDHRCSPSRRSSSSASSSSSGVASTSRESSSELAPPVGGCFSDSGCDDFVASSSSSSKSRQSSISECHAVKPETSEELQQR